MLTHFTNLRISVKIMLAVALCALLAIFIAGFGASRLTHISNQTSALVNGEAEGVRLAGAVNTAQNRIQQLWLFSVIEHDAKDFADLMNAVKSANGEIDVALDQLKGSMEGAEVDQFRQLETGLEDYRAATAKIVPLWRAGRLDDAEDVLQHDAIEPAAAIDSAARFIVKAQRERLEAGAKAAANDASRTTFTLIAVSVIGLILIAGAVLWMVRSQVTRPLSAMTALMGRVAGGDTDVDISGGERRDEIGAMARAVQVFRDNARERDATGAEQVRAEAEQKRVVDTLTESLGRLSEGDLTAEIRTEFSPTYAKVRSNFNSALASLRGLVGDVTISAETIRTGSGEIAQASEDLARRTEANAASLEQTATAITEMDKRLTATAEAAGRTVERTDDAIQVVGSGRGIADKTVQAMERVSESAKGIDSVIEGLDKIAFQTRVLAMNAAVEAGRAGEAGRGFAVVADLVSALAMRAEEESKRARDQLSVTQTDIGQAVGMVGDVDGSLARISEAVSAVHELVGQMASDNQSQAAAVVQIRTAITTMDQSTQQNAAMVEQTSAAARNLSTEAQNLGEMTDRFITEGGGASVTAEIARPIGARLH